MDDLLREFLTETSESLDTVDNQLVKFEQEPNNAKILDNIFRIVHTIKGTCGFLGLPRLEAVAHAAENVLGRYRDGTRPVTQQGISLILAALDRIRAVVAGLESTGAEPAGEDAPLIAQLDAEAEGDAAAAPAAVPEMPRLAASDPMPRPAPELVPAAPVEAAAAGSGSPPQTIRVSVDVLEDLMMLVSELVLTRNQLLQ